MKHLTLILFLIALLFSISGCDYIKNYDKPHLELSDGPPYKLTISNFEWSYGTTSFNQFNGNFDKLDEKVFDLLKDKTGFCQVYIEQLNTDKYGNADSTTRPIGHIIINELAKYHDWQYWQKDYGIRKMLYETVVRPYIQRNDSTAVLKDTSTLSSKPVTQPSYTPTHTGTKIYNFTEAMLYPTDDDRKDLDSNHYAINGVIANVNFDSGVMQIQTADELLDIQYYPLNASSEVASKLRIALASGNHIKSVCARAGASTLDLVSCKVTVDATEALHGDTTKKM